MDQSSQLAMLPSWTTLHVPQEDDADSSDNEDHISPSRLSGSRHIDSHSKRPTLSNKHRQLSVSHDPREISLRNSSSKSSLKDSNVSTVSNSDIRSYFHKAGIADRKRKTQKQVKRTALGPDDEAENATRSVKTAASSRTSSAGASSSRRPSFKSGSASYSGTSNASDGPSKSTAARPPKSTFDGVVILTPPRSTSFGRSAKTSDPAVKRTRTIERANAKIASRRSRSPADRVGPKSGSNGHASLLRSARNVKQKNEHSSVQSSSLADALSAVFRNNANISDASNSPQKVDRVASSRKISSLADTLSAVFEHNAADFPDSPPKRTKARVVEEFSVERFSANLAKTLSAVFNHNATDSFDASPIPKRRSRRQTGGLVDALSNAFASNANGELDFTESSREGSVLQSSAMDDVSGLEDEDSTDIVQTRAVKSLRTLQQLRPRRHAAPRQQEPSLTQDQIDEYHDVTVAEIGLPLGVLIASDDEEDDTGDVVFAYDEDLVQKREDNLALKEPIMRKVLASNTRFVVRDRPYEKDAPEAGAGLPDFQQYVSTDKTRLQGFVERAEAWIGEDATMNFIAYMSKRGVGAVKPRKPRGQLERLASSSPPPELLLSDDAHVDHETAGRTRKRTRGAEEASRKRAKLDDGNADGMLDIDIVGNKENEDPLASLQSYAALLQKLVKGKIQVTQEELDTIQRFLSSSSTMNQIANDVATEPQAAESENALVWRMIAYIANSALGDLGIQKEDEDALRRAAKRVTRSASK